MANRPSWQTIQDAYQDFKISPKPASTHVWDFFATITQRLRKAADSDGWYSVNDDMSLKPDIAAFFYAFNGTGAKIFKIGREFGEQLLRTDLDLAPEHLPTRNDIACIEFPETVRFASGVANTYLHCAYVMTVDNADKRFQMSSESRWPKGQERTDTPDKFMIILSPVYDEHGVLLQGQMDMGSLPLYGDDPTLSYVIDRANKCVNVPWNGEFIAYLIKCLIYIDSGDPDLREYRPPRFLKPRHRKDWAKRNPDSPAVPLIYVGYDYKKEHFYSKDMSTVTGHFRWQPHGQGRSKVKLIWISAHERHYKNVRPQV